MGPHLSLGHGVGIVRVSAPEKHRRVGGDTGTCWVQQSGPGTLVRTVPKPPPTDPTVASPAAHFVFLGHRPQLPVIALHLTHAGCWASMAGLPAGAPVRPLAWGAFLGAQNFWFPERWLPLLYFPSVFPLCICVPCGLCCLNSRWFSFSTARLLCHFSLLFRQAVEGF